MEFRKVSGQLLEAAFDVAAGGGQRREAARGREPDHLHDVIDHCAVAAEERQDAEIDVRRHACVQRDLAFAVCSTSLDGGEIEERERDGLLQLVGPVTLER